MAYEVIYMYPTVRTWVQGGEDGLIFSQWRGPNGEYLCPPLKSPGNCAHCPNDGTGGCTLGYHNLKGN